MTIKEIHPTKSNDEIPICASICTLGFIFWFSCVYYSHSCVPRVRFDKENEIYHNLVRISVCMRVCVCMCVMTFNRINILVATVDTQNQAQKVECLACCHSTRIPSVHHHHRLCFYWWQYFIRKDDCDGDVDNDDGDRDGDERQLN